MTDVPSPQQCTVPDCERRATDPLRPGALCDHHLSGLSGENGGEEAESGDATPGVETERPAGGTGEWGEIDFSAITPGVYPPELLEREQWMGRGGASGKQPFAPWGDADAAVECTKSACPAHDSDTTPEAVIDACDDCQRHQSDDRLTCAECNHDARWKWGYEENYVDGETLAMYEDDPEYRTAGRTFLQREDDPFAFVDGDKVLCPETGAVHPAFVAILEHLGPTYADVSTSGTGAHAPYRGDLPIEKGQATFPIDDEPWGANDDPPTIEIYANKHVCVATGDHVSGTPLEVKEWNTDALAAILEANGYTDEPEIEYDTDRDRPDLEDYDPTATGADETTTDVRDILAAVDSLRPIDLPLQTRQVGTDSTGWEKWDPSSYRTSSGNDSLHTPDGQTFHDHKEGESFGLLSLFAAEQGIITDPWDRLAGDDWWAAVDAAREAGAPIPEYESPADTELVSALPLGALDALNLDEQQRYLRKRGVDWPSSAEVSDRIHDAVVETMRDDGYAIIDAPTGGNKTGVAVETAWREVDDGITGDRPTVLFCETRDARDEAIERAEAAGLVYLDLYGRKELCDVAGGKYDPANIDDDDPDAPDPILLEGKPASQWFDERCDERGLAFSAVHREAEDLLTRQGRACPCCEGEYICDSKAQWPSDGLVDDDGHPRFDLVIATDPFAFVPSLTQDTNVLHDEQPDYTEDFGLDASDYPSHGKFLEALNARLRGTITAFLGLSDDGPDTFEALVQLARECASYDAAPWNEHATPEEQPPEDVADRWRATFDALGYEPDRQWYFSDPRAHTLAPAVAKAIWGAITDGVGAEGGPFDANGRASATVAHDPPRLDDDAREDDGWNRTWVTVVVDDENTIRRVRNAPDFSTARAVVGLDARPTPWLWQRNVHPEMDVQRVLERDERQFWRRFERGQTVVQVGDATRPAGKDGRYFTEAHARAVIDTLRDYFSDDFRTVGCPSGFEDEIHELLREAGVPEDVIETMHFGEEKSRNDFAEELIGLVYGCIDPGDDYVLDWLAECGLDARPERSDTECDDCGGDGCHECDGEGQKRARGRGFDGPDADHADALLESVRGTHVAQMVGRFGRDLDVDGGERNLTFVATDAIPADLVDYRVDGVQWVATDLQREIVGDLETRPSATTREIADAAECSKEHVRETLTRLADRDDSPVRRRRGVGPHGADAWKWHGGSGVDDVQLRLDEIANGGVSDNNTWSLAVSRPADALGLGDTLDARDVRPPSPAIDADPPPDPAD